MDGEIDYYSTDLTNNVLQIAVSGNAESGETLYALTTDGRIYEQKGVLFRYKVNENSEPDPKGAHTRSKWFSYWQQVPLNTEPVIPDELLAAKWTKDATP